MRAFTLVVSLLLFWSIGYSQNTIPLGAWRLHLSAQHINHIAFANGQVYAASTDAIFEMDEQGKEVKQISKLNGLSGSPINAIANDENEKILLIGCRDGNLDIIDDATISNFDQLSKTNSISGSRTINHIFIQQQVAYMAADFGLVVFDLAKKEIRETWRDLGVNGETILIFQSTVFNDSIFLATEKGVQAGKLSDNLLDFNKWKRYSQPEFAGGVAFITTFNNNLLAATGTTGIFMKTGGQWIKQAYLQAEKLNSLTASSLHLIAAGDLKIWKIDTNNQVTEFPGYAEGVSNEAKEKDNGFLYVANSVAGLRVWPANATGYLPTPADEFAPFNNAVTRICWRADGIITSFGGGFDQNMQPLNNPGKYDAFTGTWTTVDVGVKDLTDGAYISSDHQYFSSFGNGLVEITNAGTTIHTTQNSPIETDFIPAIENSSDGLWVGNYSAAHPLHLLKSDGTWESFSFSYPQATGPIDLAVDHSNNVWMVIASKNGGGIVVFNKTTNKTIWLNEQAGQGGLPHRNVRSILTDRQGQIWVGTDSGVAYFPDPASVFSGAVNAVRPIFENRYLLRDEKVLALAVDGGNRKWIGTENGVWLFSPTGEDQIYAFNTENSPMLSNLIQSIGIHPETGEVFLGTDRGIASVRSDATAGRLNFSEARIFPNPVTNDFNGLVAISGLITDSTIKITDISGKLIWQTLANGGTATWNVKDLNGRRVSTGVYLVFSTSPDGDEKNVGKIAVVN